MNQIEIWFGIINRKLLKRKSYTSIEELKESIQRFIEQYDLAAHPFKWTYTGVPLTCLLYTSGNKQKCHRIRQIQKELVNLYYKEISKKM